MARPKTVVLPIKDLVPGMFVIIDEYWRGFSYVFIISVEFNRHENVARVHYMKNGRIHVIRLGSRSHLPPTLEEYDFTTHASIVVKP